MDRMGEEQAVSEQLTLNNSKKWSSMSFKTFNNSTIMMTNKSDLFFVAFDLIQQAALVNLCCF